ncbi:MAG TPA: xanthine dehydrogenase family protein subunit M [Desulfobacterales bacterium]|nr:xanthine dehydrogenase family protein subunit M [Desulfobacterales bacterium]
MLPRFEYIRAKNLNEAIRILSTEENGVKVLAGGTDIFVEMKQGQSRPQLLVDIKSIPELSQLSIGTNGELSLGAAVKLAELEYWAAGQKDWSGLSITARNIGSEQVRNRGTVVGNVCRASPAADMAPMLIAMDARVEIVGSEEPKLLLVEDFLVGPGQTVLKTGELVKSLKIPKPPSNTGTAFLKLGKRRAMNVAIVSIAAKIAINGANRIKSASLVLGAVAPTPIRILEAETILSNDGLTKQSLEKISNLAIAAAKPITDFRSTKDYRLKIVRILTQRVLKQAWKRATQARGI